MVSYHLNKGEQLEAVLNSTFKEMEDITDVREMTNTQLKRLIQKIEVDKDGNVDIYLRLIGDLGLDETVLIDGVEDAEENVDYDDGTNQGKGQDAKQNQGTEQPPRTKSSSTVKVTNTSQDKTTPKCTNRT